MKRGHVAIVLSGALHAALVMFASQWRAPERRAIDVERVELTLWPNKVRAGAHGEMAPPATSSPRVARTARAATAEKIVAAPLIVLPQTARSDEKSPSSDDDPRPHNKP